MSHPLFHFIILISMQRSARAHSYLLNQKLYSLKFMKVYKSSESESQWLKAFSFSNHSKFIFCNLSRSIKTGD